MTAGLDLLRSAVDQVADFGFAWAGFTRDLHKEALMTLDADEAKDCQWADFGRFVALLKRYGAGTAVVQLHDGDRKVFVVSRDHVYRSPVDPHPRINEGQSGHNCPYCGIRIDKFAVDVPTRQTPEGRIIHEVCVDLWRTLPKAKKDARPVTDDQAAA